MQPIQCFPIMALPRACDGKLTAAFAEAGQMQEREHGFVDFFEVGFHGRLFNHLQRAEQGQAFKWTLITTDFMHG